ncbi:MAG TPA: condensation domain-containing protein, partial [Longimicrobiaceae bacterium]|nr:condensation domain-containing protein [Longimicrobiaceae bacterium]
MSPATVQAPEARRQLLEQLLRKKVARATHFPLSFAQQRLWFLDQMEPGSSDFNLHRAIRVRGPLDARALQSAVTELERRHEALRTTFRQVDGEPVQVIAAPAPAHVPVVELRGLPVGPREAEAARLADAEAARPFDLAAGPLLRVRVVRVADEEWTLLLTIHHIVSDRW